MKSLARMKKESPITPPFAIGIDLVDIPRFTHWACYHNRLTKLYTQAELEYCFRNPLKTAERLAVRFAAKEALYKALCQLVNHKPLFFALARAACLKPTGALIVEWPALNITKNHYLIQCSVSHAQKTASAVVFISTVL